MQFVAALRIFHLAGVIPAVLRLQIRQNQFPRRQNLHISGGIGAYLLRSALVPLSRRIADRVARQSSRASPRAHNVPAEGRDPGWYSIRRHLRRHPRTLTLAYPSAAGHPELVFNVLLQIGRLEVRARCRQRPFAVIKLLPSVNDSAEFFCYLCKNSIKE